MKTTIKNPHAWFFASMRNVQGNEDRDEVRKAIIFQYSDGKTDSLVELYTKFPSAYVQMRNDLTRKKQMTFDPVLDKARKRVLKVFHVNLERRGYKEKSNEFVKSMICRATKYKRFNQIPLNTLQAIYREFGEKNAKLFDPWASDLLEQISTNK